MTVSHHAVPIHVPSLVAALGTLRAHGLRISSARRLVLEALFAADGPITADEVAGGLDGRLPASDLASVYRNLDTLETLGVVRHVHVGHGPGLYALAGRHEAGYVACDRCGRRVVLEGDALDAVGDAVRAACGFACAFDHFPLVGRCPDCVTER
jgi:Fur family transcriptional regulator, ferric uptake regulator